MKTNKQRVAYNKELETTIDTYTIPLPMYRCSVRILDRKNTNKLNKLWKENIIDYDMAATNNLGKSTKDILIKVYKYSRSNLVHELYHCVDFIFEHIGEDKPYNCMETRAYLMGYLYDEAMKLEKYLKK